MNKVTANDDHDIALEADPRYHIELVQGEAGWYLNLKGDFVLPDLECLCQRLRKLNE